MGTLSVIGEVLVTVKVRSAQVAKCIKEGCLPCLPDVAVWIQNGRGHVYLHLSQFGRKRKSVVHCCSDECTSSGRRLV